MAKHATYEIIWNASVFYDKYPDGRYRLEYASIEELKEGLDRFFAEYPLTDDDHKEEFDIVIKRTTRDDSNVD